HATRRTLSAPCPGEAVRCAAKPAAMERLEELRSTDHRKPDAEGSVMWNRDHHALKVLEARYRDQMQVQARDAELHRQQAIWEPLEEGQRQEIRQWVLANRPEAKRFAGIFRSLCLHRVGMLFPARPVESAASKDAGEDSYVLPFPEETA